MDDFSILDCDLENSMILCRRTNGLANDSLFLFCILICKSSSQNVGINLKDFVSFIRVEEAQNFLDFSRLLYN